MVDVTVWQVLLVANKVLMYGCMAGIIGGPLISLLLVSAGTSLPRILHQYHRTAAIIGLISLATYLLFETAAFSESGLAGLIDIDTLLILWDSPIGRATLYRICGFSLFLVGYVVVSRVSPNYSKPIFIIGYAVIAGLLLRSFSTIGHSTSLHPMIQILLSIHVFMVMAWLGSLYPLQQCCGELPAKNLHLVMHRFGQYARFVVMLLLATGIVTAYQLIHSLDELLSTLYGQIFMGKLLLSMVVLLIAAIHKWRLVPQLISNNSTQHILARSIQYEMICMAFILTAVAIITTIIGPSHLM